MSHSKSVRLWIYRFFSVMNVLNISWREQKGTENTWLLSQIINYLIFCHNERNRLVLFTHLYCFFVQCVLCDPTWDVVVKFLSWKVGAVFIILVVVHRTTADVAVVGSVQISIWLCWSVSHFVVVQSQCWRFLAGKWYRFHVFLRRCKLLQTFFGE